MPNWEQLRREFPSLSRWTYLDTASFGQVPKAASEAVIRHLRHRDETASAKFLSWFDDMDEIRELCARLVNGSVADIAFVPNASTGLSWLMQGLSWKADDEVITLMEEFPNQLYQSAATCHLGVTFRAVPWEDFYTSISERTRLVLLSTVNYASGFRPPIDKISQFLRARGVLLYLDGTQSLGALKCNVRELRPAMFCVDAYKWMMSPNGAGFVYIDQGLREQLRPTLVGWRSDAGWRDVNSLNHGAPNFAETAEKFEGAMLPFPSLYGMGAVVRMLLEAGPAAVEARVLELSEKTRQLLTQLGGEVNGDASQIVTVRLPGQNSSEVAHRLKTRNIIVSARHERLRVSVHFYNNEADLEALKDALRP
jgi:selenocysteine lyase/cysteine desulfurase